MDSLDAVEVVMAVEEEFGIEIPDAEADEITSVGQGESAHVVRRMQPLIKSDLAIDYVAKVCSDLQ